MECNGEDVPLADRNRMPVHLCQDIDVFPDVLHPRRPDENGVHRRAVEVELCLERRKLTTERVTPHTDIEHAEVLPRQHDHPCAGAKNRLAALRELNQRLPQTLAFDSEADRRGFAAGNHECIERIEVHWSANLANLGTQLAQGSGVCCEAPLKGQYADSHQPRFWSSPPFS